MQIFEINQLPKYQQEIILPVIEKQKKYEKRKLRLRPYINLVIWTVAFLILFIASVFGIIDFVKSGFNYDLFLPTFVILIINIGFFCFNFAAIYFTKTIINKTNEDDFYIICGCITDKKWELAGAGRNKVSIHTEYKYIIENKSFYVRKNVFKDFKYKKIPIGEYRYLLLRKFDNRIRADLTEYFKKV